ncbi:DUF3048 domain-containing protein [Halobacillus rhizosphaerae]|uniref:DUF3048 domain-containing protein n=1 Tax=Halobacillus rhizosphaerae TaxID=3064889 RepID=UPI00398A96AC
MKKPLSMVAIFLLIICLAACQSKGNESSRSADSHESSRISKEVKEQPEKKEEQETNVYPLTGELANGGIDNQVIGVMVNNHSLARPQTGLSKADVVYEVLAEGQITRFLALFQSEIPDKIGPVRSARPYYLELAQGFNALYIYHGASVAINQTVANSGTDFLNGSMYDNNGWLFQRSTDRSAPHNSYLLTSGINQALEAKGYDNQSTIPPLPFADDDQLNKGQPVTDVTITYSEQPEEIVSFTYDTEIKQFLRSSDGEPTVEKETNQRIAVDNIFVVETSHQVVDGKGRRSIDLTSGGKGYLFYKGEMLQVNWKNVNGRILPYLDGEPLPFARGKTWVNIVPTNTKVAAQ